MCDCILSCFNNVKKEFSDILSLILSPFLYQGFQSIFDTARNYRKKNNIETSEFRIFQDLLRNIIPNWSQDIIQQEVKRIKILSKHGETLDLLLKAILKSMLHIQSCQRSFDSCKHISKQMYEDVSFALFIHKAYIASARKFFNNPFIFDVIEKTEVQIKENQKEALDLISQSIHGVLWELLPLHLIVKEFLESTPVSSKISVALVSDDVNPIPKQSSAIVPVYHPPIGNVDTKTIVPQPVKPPRLLDAPRIIENLEISMINTKGENHVQNVLKDFDMNEVRPDSVIKEPTLVHEADIRSIAESEPFQLNKNNNLPVTSHHTLTNFLKEVPVADSEIKHSVIDDFEDVFVNK